MAPPSQLGLCILLTVLAGCGPVRPAPPDGAKSSGAGSALQSRQTITIAAQNSLKGFSPWLAGTTGGGGRTLYELFINGLVSTDADGGIEARLAARLPSFDDGTIVILPDGRMKTTWKLRPN